MVRAILLHAYRHKPLPPYGGGNGAEWKSDLKYAVSSPARGDRTED